MANPAQTNSSVKTILLTGPDGFVGRALTRELAKQGYRLRLACRTANVATPETGETICIGDIGPNTYWATAVVGCHAVVHLAARVHIMRDMSSDPPAEYRKTNVEGTRRLAQAASLAGVKRFIFLSSIKVNGEATNRTSGPFKDGDSPHPRDAYATSKWEAEQVLREIEQQTDMQVVIIRPPLIYGPGVKANFLELFQLIESGLPLPFGGIKNKRSFLGLTNLVDLICCCLEQEEAAGETFLASDCDDVSTPELGRRIAHALARPARLMPIPEWAMKLGGMITGKTDQVSRLCSSLQIDSSRLSRTLGWVPRCSMQEELARIASWYKART